MFSFQIFVGSRRELVANSIHTADADATPTQLNSTDESRRRRRCVLGISQASIRAREKSNVRLWQLGPVQPRAQTPDEQTPLTLSHSESD